MRKKLLKLLGLGFASIGLFCVLPQPNWLALKLLDQGKSYWKPLKAEDYPEESWLKTAYSKKSQELSYRKAVWKSLEKGMLFSEIDILHNESNISVETLYLTKIDPSYFSFNLHNDPSANRDADEWLDYLGAQVVINGSYYNKLGAPDTPSMINGNYLGPKNYTATHGAFVMDQGVVNLIDFAEKESLGKLLNNRQNFFVSYPLLLDRNGESRSQAKVNWFANRSFIGITRNNQVILGCTKNAYFSLNDLGPALKKALPELKSALNLDGGPVSSMAINSEGFRRTFYGKWETAGTEERPMILHPGNRGKKWPLPIAISVRRLK